MAEIIGHVGNIMVEAIEASNRRKERRAERGSRTRQRKRNVGKKKNPGVPFSKRELTHNPFRQVVIK